MTSALSAAPSEIITYLAAARGTLPAPRRLPVPALGPDDLLVAVEHVALGAPELATLRDRPGVAPGGAAVGHVVATGAAAGDHLGRRVLVGPHHACGECDECRAGNDNQSIRISSRKSMGCRHHGSLPRIRRPRRRGHSR